MSVVAARKQPRRRSGRRLLIILLAIVVVVAAALFWLNEVAQAAVDASGVVTVYQPATQVEPAGATAFATASTGTLVRPGDSVQTDIHGRASVTLPDGSITRLAGSTEMKLTSAHFAKDGNLQDASWLQSLGRTLTHVEHLVSGATFQVAGQSAVASVRGTTFEVLINADGSMTVKLFDGTLHFHGKNDVTLSANEEATADPQGNISQPAPIQADPDDPFISQLAASVAADTDTTPGTEEDFIGPPIHNGAQQKDMYSYAGGALLKAVLGYTGGSMSVTVKAPDGTAYNGSGPSPVIVAVKNAPAGIYTVLITGVSGIGTAGEEPFLAVSSLEPCVSADTDVNGAVHRGYSATDLQTAVQVAGLSSLNLAITGRSTAGAIVSGTGTYNGIGWGGTIVLVNHGGVLMVIAIEATVFGIHIPAGQILQQIGAAARQDPSTINPGYIVDRLFTCQSILMIDGHHG